LAIKQMMHLADRELAEFLSKSEIGRLIILDIGIFGVNKINEYIEDYKEDGAKVIILNAKARPTSKKDEYVVFKKTLTIRVSIPQT